jgi:hypothetical protein
MALLETLKPTLFDKQVEVEESETRRLFDSEKNSGHVIHEKGKVKISLNHLKQIKQKFNGFVWKLNDMEAGKIPFDEKEFDRLMQNGDAYYRILSQYITVKPEEIRNGFEIEKESI